MQRKAASRLVMVFCTTSLAVALSASAADRTVLMEYFNATW
jgi:hypothetical protein